MLLAVDIGNTNIDVGVFRERELFRHWIIRAEKGKTCDEYKVTLLFSLSQVDVVGIEAVIISSVVPPITPVFSDLSQSLFRVKPLIAGPGLKTGMPILYENPMEVGADRVVGAIAAYAKYGGPCIVVDFGTATTFDAISSEGQYLGGAIAPGVQISAEALYLRTAKLPRVEIAKPKMAIGRSTVASMHSGLFYGYIGLVSKIIDVIDKELGGGAVTVATGGYSGLIGGEIDAIQHHEPHLVLEGLRLLYEKNSG
jgi:type III pantothenate kinase